MMNFILLKHEHSFGLNNIVAIWHEVHNTILINTVHLLFTLPTKTVLGCLKWGKCFQIEHVSLTEWSKVSAVTHRPCTFPIILYTDGEYCSTAWAWFVIQFTIFRQITANKSLPMNISPALAGINDICVWLEVTEICDCTEEYRYLLCRNQYLLLLVWKYDK